MSRPADRRPPARTDRDVNLAPIMNIVMILIPLILMMVQFDKVAVLSPAPSPTSAANASPDADPDAPVPRVQVSITDHGYVLSNLTPGMDAEAIRAWTEADPGCAPAVVCATGAGTAPLVARLDYDGLSAQLGAIRSDPRWAADWPEGADVVTIAADPDVPFDAVVATMDAAVLAPQGQTPFAGVALGVWSVGD